MTKTCGEVLVEILEAYGIDTVFGIPGVHTVELYRGLPNTGIRHVTPRHEQGAGFMADGYARASGRPAACFIISGPGMTNIVTAMGQAYSDSIPMLVISSVNISNELGMGEGRLHELPDQSGLVRGVSVFSHRLLRAADLPAVMARAFAVFDSARPGPVHIELPLDVITAPADALDRAAYRTRSRPGPDPDAIARAAALLRDAKNPFVVLGGGTAGAADAARALVERLGAPVALTINAKGVLPPAHPLSLGSSLPLPPVIEALQAADVVLAIGTELGETDTLLFGQALALAGKLIRIDIDAEQMTRNALAAVAICSDAGLAMRALHDALATPARAPADGAGGAPARRGRRRPARGLPDARPHSRRRRRGAPRRDHRGGFHPAGLRRQPRLRARRAAVVVQLLHRLRHARLRPAGGLRRQARPPRRSRRGADRRRRHPVHHRRTGDRGGARACRSRSCCGTTRATARSRPTWPTATSRRSASTSTPPTSRPSPAASAAGRCGRRASRTCATPCARR